MRAYSGGTPFGEIAVLNGKLAAACRERLLPRAGETLLPRQAEWLFLPQNCRRPAAGLAPFGYEIGDARHFCLPSLPCPETVPLGAGGQPHRAFEG